MKKYAAFIAAIVLALLPTAAQADDERTAEPAEESSAFFRDGKFNATLFYFQRYRDRHTPKTGHYRVNLSHASTQLALDFESGYIEDAIGFDFGIFAAYDLYNHSESADHEMNFVPWRNPWQPDWNKIDNKNAASIYKALVKIKAGPAWLRAGYFQPQGPGVLGVNWSFLPGTYQGAETGLDLGNLKLAAAWANQYKAPWFTRTYKFKKKDANGELHDVDYLWSLGARYQAAEGLSLELAYGESEGYRWNAHFKAKYNRPIGDDNLYLTWQTYAMNDKGGYGSVGDSFASTAWQQYLAAVYSSGPWTSNLEFTYSRAPNKNDDHLGYFAYRLTTPSGSSKGAYEPWWDLRSDWNHHNEKAVFLKIGRSLDDLGLHGVKAALSGAYGWGGQSWKTHKNFSEAAFGADLSYTVDQGFLEGAVFAVHFTNYDNRTKLKDWDPFNNAFQDEHDIKFSMIIPLGK